MFYCKIILQVREEKGEADTMECYYAHLPHKMSEFTDKSDPPIKLVSARHCPYQGSLCKKNSVDICCLGIDKQCVRKCPNKQ